MNAISLAIVGVQYPNQRGPTRRFELELCKPGEPIDLVPEPKNKHDENAIAIFSCRGVQMGYVTAERAPLVLSYIRTGQEVRAVFQGVSTTGPWIRVTFDGSEPVVDLADTRPPPADGSSGGGGGDGFWPDPVYEEE